MIDARPMLETLQIAVFLAPSVDVDRVIRTSAARMIDADLYPECRKTLVLIAQSPKPYAAIQRAIKVAESA